MKLIKGGILKLDFSQSVFNVHEKPIVMNEGGAPASLGDLCVEALCSEYQDEQLSGSEKFARYLLAKSIKKGSKEFTIDEVSKIKLVVGKRFTPAVVGPMYELLEGAEK